jgi:cytidylate kinase
MMNAESEKTVVLFSGLPYTGKTAIIHRLLEGLPGEAIYVDGLFRDIVSEKEVCLERWLEEGPRLVDGIIAAIANAKKPLVYVELGIMQMKHRTKLMHWVRNSNYHLVPILLQCESRKAVRQRQQARARAIAAQPEKLKIAIDLDELYGPISAAFDEIMDWEGYHTIDTNAPIEINVEEICRLILG